jgi:hypothetical protein
MRHRSAAGAAHHPETADTRTPPGVESIWAGFREPSLELWGEHALAGSDLENTSDA